MEGREDIESFRLKMILRLVYISRKRREGGRKGGREIGRERERERRVVGQAGDYNSNSQSMYICMYISIVLKENISGGKPIFREI